MIKCDSGSLWKIIDTISGIRGYLFSLGSEIVVLNGTLVHIILSKVEAKTKLNYDEKQNFKSLPTWDSFYDVLSNRC